MKKIIKFTAILLMLAGSFSSCSNKDNVNTREAYSIKEGRFNMGENEFVTMSVSPEDVFVNSSMKLTIENHSTSELLYTPVFSLEYFDKENWAPVQLDISFEDIGYILKVDEKVEGLFYVSEKYFHRLGKYRIVKSFSLSPNFPFETDSSFYLYAEFEVKLKQ